MKKKLGLAILASLSLILLTLFTGKTTFADSVSEQVKKIQDAGVFKKSVLNKTFQTLVIIQPKLENTKVWKLI